MCGELGGLLQGVLLPNLLSWLPIVVPLLLPCPREHSACSSGRCQSSAWAAAPHTITLSHQPAASSQQPAALSKRPSAYPTLSLRSSPFSIRHSLLPFLAFATLPHLTSLIQRQLILFFSLSLSIHTSLFALCHAQTSNLQSIINKQHAFPPLVQPQTTTSGWGSDDLSALTPRGRLTPQIKSRIDRPRPETASKLRFGLASRLSPYLTLFEGENYFFLLSCSTLTEASLLLLSLSLLLLPTQFCEQSLCVRRASIAAVCQQ